MKDYPEASAREPSDAALIATAQSRIKALINEHVRRDRPRWELRTICEPVVRQLKDRLSNDETREAVDEAMARYVDELYEHFSAFYAAVRGVARILVQQKAVPRVNSDGIPKDGIPISTDPLSYNMETGARDYFEAYQRNVRRELDYILHAEPRRYDGNVNLRLIAELNVRYEKQNKMINDLASQGEDLVWIEPHANCSARCEPWQGRLYSLSGRSGKTEDGIAFRPLSDATDVFVTTRRGRTYRNGCITGFGCRHKLVPDRPGSRPQTIPAEVVERQRCAEEHQRALERRIRYEKERAAILARVDPNAARESRARARGLTIQYNRFSAQHDLAAVPTRLRTVQGEEIYRRNAPLRERRRYSL